jgi:chromosomal replication initiation ATPase DnaA
MSIDITYTGVMPATVPARVVVSYTAALKTKSEQLGSAMPAPLPSMRSIAQEVADKYEMSLEELRGPNRSPYVAHPRFEAMWRMRQQHRWSLPQIGRFFSNRDHTTVLHGIRRHQERLAKGLVRP